jgi:hypothetical protein
LATIRQLFDYLTTGGILEVNPVASGHRHYNLDCLQNGGTLELTQPTANHESPRTAKLYDRSREEFSFEEVERIKNLNSSTHEGK